MEGGASWGAGCVFFVLYDFRAGQAGPRVQVFTFQGMTGRAFLGTEYPRRDGYFWLSCTILGQVRRFISEGAGFDVSGKVEHFWPILMIWGDGYFWSSCMILGQVRRFRSEGAGFDVSGKVEHFWPI